VKDRPRAAERSMGSKLRGGESRRVSAAITHDPFDLKLAGVLQPART